MNAPRPKTNPICFCGDGKHTLVSQVGLLCVANEAMQETIAALQTDNVQCKTRIAGMREDVEFLSKENTGLRETIAACEKRVRESESQLEPLRTHNKTLQGLLDEQKAQDISRGFYTARGTIASLENQLEKVTFERDSLKREAEEARITPYVYDLKQEIMTLEQKLEHAKFLTDVANSDLELSVDHAESLRAELAESVRKYNRLKTSVDFLIDYMQRSAADK